MARRIMYILLTGLVFLSSGCYYELISWSPDSRYALFTLPDKKILWQWDKTTGKTNEIIPMLRDLKDESASKPEPLNRDILGCSYLPGASRALVYTKDEIFILDIKSGLCDLLDNNVGTGIYVSGKGERIFYVKKNEVTGKEGNAAQKEYSLMEYQNGEKRVLFSGEEEISFPGLSPDNRYIMYSTSNSLCLYDLKEEKSRIIFSEQGGDIFHPMWVNNNQIIYAVEKETKGSAWDLDGAIYRLSIDPISKKPASKPHILKNNIYLPVPFRIDDYTYEIQRPEKDMHSAGSEVTEPVIIATAVMPGETERTQAAIISIKTGDTLWESDGTYAAAPALSPDGKILAYLSGIGDFMYLETQDMKTGKRSIAWRNEAEKLFATAEDLKQAGEFQKALEAYRAFIKQFPDSDIVKAACFHMASILLKPQLLDLDAAYDALKNFDNEEARLILEGSLWRPEDRIAVDSPKDWIQTYGTKESEKYFGFNTDLARDLRGLWMREGKERLYIRIDYGTNNDLDGLTFQDTMLLFDYDTPDEGSRKISDNFQWDRGADRKALIRHWHESGEQSQYDLEVLDEKDEIIHRYLVSGFAPPDNPLIRHCGIYRKKSNSIIYAISRRILNLKAGNRVQVQVCTFKGGIESYKKLETPRFDPAKAFCDVADAFGEENNIERIRKDKEEKPGLPVIIRGYAGEFDPAK